jgi:hypothetical protein
VQRPNREQKKLTKPARTQAGNVSQQSNSPPHPLDQVASAFAKHKDILLAVLLDAHRPKSEPFDADTAWDELRSLARLYFGLKWERPQQRAAADRRVRLSKFAKSLRKAHRLFDEIKHDEFIMYLHCRYGTQQERLIEPVRPNDELDKVLVALSTLEAAACFALNDDFYTPFPPGPVAALSLEFIEILARIYESATGRPPGAGQGPFYRFVMNFRAAVDLSYKTKDESGDPRLDESMIGDIKKALRRKRCRPSKEGGDPVP